MICKHCGAPVKYHRLARGWLHSQPLGEFRLSHFEAVDIAADPPRAGQGLHRSTYIHPAAPERN